MLVCLALESCPADARYLSTCWGEKTKSCVLGFYQVYFCLSHGTGCSGKQQIIYAAMSFRSFFCYFLWVPQWFLHDVLLTELPVTGVVNCQLSAFRNGRKNLHWIFACKKLSGENKQARRNKAKNCISSSKFVEIFTTTLHTFGILRQLVEKIPYLHEKFDGSYGSYAEEPFRKALLVLWLTWN